MDESQLEKWKKAGKLAAEAIEYGKSLIKKDKSILEVAEKIEKKIYDSGAKPAWPVNISFNATAAHDTPTADDKRTFQEDVIKLDVGVYFEGAIGDTALTVDLTKSNHDLLKASEAALNNAIKLLKPGLTLSEIGREIEATITEAGFKPVRNLSGHGVKENDFHAEPSVPNYDNKDKRTLFDGQIIAIEPFATAGIGLIEEVGKAEILQLRQSRPLRDATARQILKQLESYNNCPFAVRWLKYPPLRLNFTLKEMERLEMLNKYPPLVEKARGLVSQFEHTIYVSDKPIVLTKP